MKISHDAFHIINKEFNAYFKLDDRGQLKDFFVAKPGNLKQFSSSTLKRFKHFCKNGVWIDESRLCAWAEVYTDRKLAELLQTEELIAEAKLSRALQGKAVEQKVLRREHEMVVAKTPFLESTRTALRFFGEFILHPNTVGAILPSSKLLAREMVKEIPKDLKAEKRLILEVGPGTGVFTDKILLRMNPGDELHLVEYDHDFALRLKKKYAHIANVKIIEGDILAHQLGGREKYDFVISGLPLNAFSSEFVGEVFKKFTELTKDGGKISYFEYLAMPAIKKLFSNAEERENLNKILAMKNDFYRSHKLRKENVYVNAPCARVLHHELKFHCNL